MSYLKHQLSIQFKGEALKAISDGFEQGISWQQIAINLHESVGLQGAGHHWVRIVRTEMVRAFDMSSKERYKNMGVTYVKFSTVPGACAICKAVQAINGGYRKLVSAETLPLHPHDRCRWLPKWSIPAVYVMAA
jgi:hypothetical protein